MNYISITNFQNMITLGAKQLLLYEEDLNAINVYPVPDGDTGSNLAFLMNMILLRQPSSDTKSHFEQLKLACLQGSRGNSGMIFSQFIITMCDFILDKQQLSRQQLITMFEFSFNKTYQSVHQPQEGTILTVMRDWVNSLKQYAYKEKSISSLLAQALQDTLASLENTKNVLAECRKNNVVDAGAKGFCYFMHGFIEGLNVTQNNVNDSFLNTQLELAVTGENKSVHDKSIYQLNMHEGSSSPLKYRYCTEFIVTDIASEEQLKKNLTKHGDSLVFIGSQSYCKLHIHTDKPHEIAELLQKEGEIMFQKVEDMQRQQDMLNANKLPIAIVIDSACDLPQQYLDEHHIHMLPLSIIVNGSHYLDKQTITASQLYRQIKDDKTDVSSSLPSREQIMRLYEQLLANYEYIVSIHVSSQLSGTYAACKQIADEMNPNKIHVVDSRTLSGAYALIVKQFATHLKHNAKRQPFYELMKKLDSLIKNNKIYVTVPSLKSMVKSGRLSSTSGKIADMLSIKPIVTIDLNGKSKLLSPTLFKHSNIPKLINIVEKVHKKTSIYEYALLYTDETAELEQIKTHMERITGKPPSFTTTVSSVIGKYAGSGAYSISILLNNEKENN